MGQLTSVKGKSSGYCTVRGRDRVFPSERPSSAWEKWGRQNVNQELIFNPSELVPDNFIKALTDRTIK